MFTCRECKKPHEDSAAKNGDITNSNTGICNPCATLKITMAYHLKKAHISPHNYFSCEDCKRVFHKWGRTPKSLYKDRPVRESCPFCQSKNINDFKITPTRGIDGGKLQ